MQEMITNIALSMGTAWARGMKLYAAILVLGLLGTTAAWRFPRPWGFAAPKVFGAVAIMYCVEFFADKFPGVDNAWDTLHTFIRIPAGAILAASVITEFESFLGLTAGLHLSEAGARLEENTSPEPFSNIHTSLTEDTVVVAGLWSAVYFLWSFCFFWQAFCSCWSGWLPILWQRLKGMFARVRNGFYLGTGKFLLGL